MKDDVKGSKRETVWLAFQYEKDECPSSLVSRIHVGTPAAMLLLSQQQSTLNDICSLQVKRQM